MEPGRQRPNFDELVSRHRWHFAAGRVLLQAKYIRYLLAKANFDPNQPRVPRGNPEGGQWTRVEGWRSSGGRAEANRTGDPAPTLVAASGPPDPGDEPHVPATRPKTSWERTAALRNAARIMLREGWRMTPAGRLLALIRWLDGYNPLLDAYNDPPRSLPELQARASLRLPGYDVHHIVERTSALRDGFGRDRVDAPANLALVPRMKHWEINGWYETEQPSLGYLTPRQYVRGKSWEERWRVGLDALREVGVLADEAE